MARGLKFWIKEVEGLYYPCSENKGADQLRGYREADLRLCFRICKKPVFSRRGSNVKAYKKYIICLVVICDRRNYLTGILVKACLYFVKFANQHMTHTKVLYPFMNTTNK